MILLQYILPAIIGMEVVVFSPGLPLHLVTVTIHKLFDLITLALRVSCAFNMKLLDEFVNIRPHSLHRVLNSWRYVERTSTQTPDVLQLT